MNRQQKIILYFLIIVILFVSYWLIIYGASYYILLAIAPLAIIFWPAVSRGLYRQSILNNPTIGAVFESGVIWLKVGSFPTIWRKGRLLFINNNLDLIDKKGKVFSIPQDEATVDAVWFYPSPISGGYVRLYIKTRQENFEIALTPPDYMDTLKTWDQTVFEKTGKYLVNNYQY